jgi:hypothetical protein
MTLPRSHQIITITMTTVITVIVHENWIGATVNAPSEPKPPSLPSISKARHHLQLAATAFDDLADLELR